MVQFEWRSTDWPSREDFMDAAPRRAWRQWQARHRGRLLGTALPAHLWRTEAKWLYFLEHGHLPGDAEGPEVRVEDLSSTDVAVLAAALDDYASAHATAGDAIRPLLARR